MRENDLHPMNLMSSKWVTYIQSIKDQLYQYPYFYFFTVLLSFVIFFIFLFEPDVRLHLDEIKINLLYQDYADSLYNKYYIINKMDNLKQAEETFQMMESGSIEINFLIEYGILFLGNTKAGKTTSAHFLCNQVLEGDKNDKGSTVFKLKSGKKQFESAKIGDQQSVSETQIPNFFVNELDGKKIYLVDCPGYLDSYGCYRIISNRFFHYQVFSKVENTKFIITFTFNDMLRTADKMIGTFRQFLKGFERIDEIKQKLISATSVIVTSVPHDKNLNDLIKLFETKHNVESSMETIFEELKKGIIAGKRLYKFEQAQLGKTCDTKNDLLKRINANSKFWKREINAQKQVDMNNIKISIVDYAGKDMERFNKQLKLMQQFYEQVLRKEIESLKKVIYKLSEDCTISEDSSLFINQILEINKLKKQWRQTKSLCKPLYEKYKDKRANLKNTLFKSNNMVGSETTFITNDSPFWLCKFKTLKQIQNYNREISVFNSDQRGYEQLNKIQSMFKLILEMFLNLAKKKKEKIVGKDNEKNEAVLDFAYEIYKNISISNKLYRLVPNLQNNETASQIESGMFFILVEYPKIVKSLFLLGMKEQFFQVFQKGVQSFKFDEKLTPKGATESARFLQDYKYEIQKGMDIEKTMTSTFVNNLDNKIVTMYNIAFESIKTQASPSLKILKNMEMLRQQTFLKIEQCTKNDFDNQKLKTQNNKIIQLMAECLLKNGHHKQAIQLYDALFDGHKVIEVMESWEDKIKNTEISQSQYLNFLISFMKLAKKYHRIELAMIKGQHALHLARDKSDIEKINEVSNVVKKLCQPKEKDEKDAYESHLFQEIVATELTKSISDRILQLSEQFQGK